MLTCIICVCTDQVPEDLVRLFGTWVLSLVLWMLRRCWEERTFSLLKHPELSLICEETWHSDYIMRDPRGNLYLYVLCRQKTHVNDELGHSSKREKKLANSIQGIFGDEQLVSPYQEISQKYFVGFISTTCNLALLTTLCRVGSMCNVKRAVTSWRRSRSCVNMERMFQNETF